MDKVSTLMLTEDDSISALYRKKISEVEDYDKAVVEACKRNGEDPAKFLIEQKFVHDLYRRSGNIILSYLREAKKAMPLSSAERDGSGFERARIKAERRMTVSAMARLDSAVNDDRNEAFEEFEDDMQRRRRKREKEEAEAERS